MDDYYERYWRKSLKKEGTATLPPVREEKNLIKIENAIKPYIRGKVLDVGCGEGYVTSFIQKNFSVKRNFNNIKYNPYDRN